MAISIPVAAVVDRGPGDPQSSAVNDRGYNTSEKLGAPGLPNIYELL